MAFFGRRIAPDGRDALSPALRMILSIVATGVVVLATEYAGTNIAHAYSYAEPDTFWMAVGAFALILGPLLVLVRRWSILVPMVIFGTMIFAFELANHYSVLSWTFADGTFTSTMHGTRGWDWTNGNLLGITNPFLIAFVGGSLEMLVIPLSVGLQKLVTLGLRRTDPAEAAQEALFANSIDPPEVIRAERKRDAGFYVLRGIGILFLVYLAYVAIAFVAGARDLPLMSSYFLNPSGTINTFGRWIVLGMLAITGAFNINIRRDALMLLVIGHVLAAGTGLWLYLAYPPNPVFPADHGAVVAGAIIDGALLLLLLAMMIRAPRAGSGAEEPFDIELESPSSTWLRRSFLASGIVFGAVAVGTIVGRIIGRPGSAMYAICGGPDQSVVTTVTKFGVYSAIAFVLYARPRLRRFLMPTLVVPLCVSIAVAFLFTITGPAIFITPGGESVAIGWYAPLDLILASTAVFGLLGVRRMMYNVDYRVTSLRPASAECVMALHDALRERGQNPEISRRDVLVRIDEYIGGIKGRRRGLIGFPFFVLEHLATAIYLLPSFSVLSREEARWMLRSRILRPFGERRRAAIPPLADLLFKLGDTLNSLVTLAFFSSARGQAMAGYVLPEARIRLQGEIAVQRPPNGAEPQALPADGADPLGHMRASNPADVARLRAPRLSVQPPPATDGVPDEVDYCIIGSGAAGSVMAYRLAAASGSGDGICVVEQGGYFGPRTDFSDDEMRMIRMLYADGGLQATRSFDFTILQGECVGGTTVINNAVCFQMPEPAQREWSGFGFDLPNLAQHYARVQSEINIAQVSAVSVNERAEARFIAGVNAYNAVPAGEPLSAPSRIMGNFGDCNGCGLCNIGCRQVRKLSMLETYLPWAQSRGVRVIPNTGAVKCEMSGSGARRRATAVIVRKADGSLGRIRVRRGVVLAAGAIASSRFLLRSGMGGNGVGEGVSCNFALPALAQFPDVIDAYDGLQIAMYAAPASYEAVYETTFNPPGAHSILLPQYFGRHQAMMERYRNSVNFGALVGSDPGGSVSRKRSVLLGRAIEWKQTAGDLARIKQALATMARFARGAGAERILLPTHPVLNIPLAGDINDTLATFNQAVNDPAFINFATAHPQGGNMMADDGTPERVVDLDFRVRDSENVYVCDASIFPRSVRVNPQWTIMALASQAAGHVA
ncbi:MAG TPA: GMC family oxidoreductase N-terminal domain-containing protein [Candidatus Kapabacteria bacterium]|nr:GMC family oxidoreductase N-terminal domain-containing protein [Candidatus Kapabacteria bacterium]